VARPRNEVSGSDVTAGPDIKRTMAEIVERVKTNREITLGKGRQHQDDTMEELAPYMRGWAAIAAFGQTLRC